MNDRDAILELFKTYSDDLGRVGGRDENLRTFYVSVISALFVFLSMAGKDGLFVNVRGGVQVIVGLVGIVICLAWFSHMQSLRNVFEAKLKTLRSLEATLPFQPFTTEHADLDARHYVHITVIDQVVPLACILLFGALVFFKLGS